MQSMSSYNKYAITNQVSLLNYVMNWEECKIKGREDHTFGSGVREATHIRQGGSDVMNQG